MMASKDWFVKLMIAGQTEPFQYKVTETVCQSFSERLSDYGPDDGPFFSFQTADASHIIVVSIPDIHFVNMLWEPSSALLKQISELENDNEQGEPNVAPGHLRAVSPDWVPRPVSRPRIDRPDRDLCLLYFRGRPSPVETMMEADDVEVFVRDLIESAAEFISFVDVDGEEVIFSSPELTLITIPTLAFSDDDDGDADDAA